MKKFRVLIFIFFCLGLAGCGLAKDKSSVLRSITVDENSTVVYLYMLGTNLESVEGKATWSINQICKATEAGDKLTVIMEAGGTKDWKAEQLLDDKTGRYLIRNGTIELIEDLGDANMMQEETLKDFLKWSGDNCPRGDGRSMLLFWDHGGGTGGGFGKDELHDMSSISVKELQNAIKESEKTYDIIGFDACLMQTIEIADALSPYGSYLLASEEREPGYGWYYTSAFEKLSKGEYLTSENLKDFGIEMVKLFTSFYKEQGHGNGQQTLSLVDMKKASKAYEEYVSTLEDLDTTIVIDRQKYSDLSISRSKSHEFCDALIDQIDLLDFINQYSEKSGTDLNTLKELTKDAIIYNSEEAPEGAYGLAVYFPYRHAELYQKIWDNMGDVQGSGSKALPFYSDFLSIIVGVGETEDSESVRSVNADYSGTKWFSEEAADAYREDFGELSKLEYVEESGKFIQRLTDTQQALLTEARLNFFFEAPENGHVYDMGADVMIEWTEDTIEPVLDFPQAWVCINGIPVSMYSDPVIEHDDKFWLNATVPALLNDKDMINVRISWGPVLFDDLDKNIDDNDNGINDAIEAAAKVSGYETDSEESAGGVFAKGLRNFKAGDKISFLYDEFDADFEYLGCADLYDPIVISSDQSELAVTYELIDNGGSNYLCWLTLIDIYQRNFDTDMISY